MLRAISSHSFTHTGFVFLLVLGLTGCSTGGDAPATSANWVGAEGVRQVGAHYFAGQPDAQMLATARAEGVDMVVNLRSPGEMKWDEATTVESLGMRYINIPVAKTGPGFDRDAMGQLHRVINDNPDQQILLHCSSGNRVSAWYAVYLVEEKNLSVAEALQLARESGLTKADLEQRVRQYFE